LDAKAAMAADIDIRIEHGTAWAERQAKVVATALAGDFDGGRTAAAGHGPAERQRFEVVAARRRHRHRRETVVRAIDQFQVTHRPGGAGIGQGDRRQQGKQQEARRMHGIGLRG